MKGWTKQSLGTLCEIYQPKTITSKDLLADGEFPVFGANGIIGRYNHFNHEEPQLLVTCRGATCGTVNMSLPRSWITGNAMVVRPKNAALSLEYLKYFFLGACDFSKVITGTAQPQITRQTLAPTTLAFPPLPEQRRIVAILDEAFEGLEAMRANSEKNLKNARELFDSYINAIFIEKGEGWISERLNKHVQFVDYRGKTPPKRETGVRLITAKNVKMGFIRRNPEEFIDAQAYDEWMTRGFPEIGDVLFTTEAPLGNVAQLDTSEKVVIGQRLITMKPDRSVLDRTFLAYMLMSKPLQDSIHAFATGATVQGIKAKLLKEIPIHFPKLISEQVRIACQIELIIAESRRLEALYRQKLAAIAELKQSLLQKAFAGELTSSESIAA